MVEPQSQIAVTSMAYRGQAVKIDDIPRATLRGGGPGSEFSEYVPSDEIDMTDLSNVNKEINALRIRLHRIRVELKNAKREALRKKIAYETEKKRTWIGISGGSDKSREALAELLTEQLYTDSMVANAVADEIVQHNRDIRSELDALREISNNLRRQIDLT